MASYHTEQKQTSYCAPCQEDGQNKEAQSFCFDCVKYFCGSCKKFHDKFTQNHNIIVGQNIIWDGNQSSLMRCKLHSSQRVDLYCTEHNFVFCKFCRETEHGKCSVRGIFEVCKERNVNDELDAILQHAENLKRRITKLRLETEVEVENFEKRKDKISEFIREMIDVLSRYEEKFDKYKETSFERQTAIIEASNVCLQKVEDHMRRLKESKAALKEDALFVSLVEFTNYCSEFEKNLKKVSAIAENHTPFKFDDERFLALRNRLSEMISEQTDSIGSDGLNQFDANTNVDKSFCNVKTCTLTKEIVIAENSTRTCISGCCFMSNGHVVLCDSEGRKIILLENNLTIKCYLDCKNEPFGVAVVDNESVVVSIPSEKSIQFISVKSGLRYDRKVQLNAECYGIVVSADIVFVGSILRDQKEKNIRKNILLMSPTGESPYKCMELAIEPAPKYLCLSSDSKKLFISSSSAYSPVACVTLDNYVVMTYVDTCLRSPCSVSSDKENNLLVGYSGSGADQTGIRVVKSNGEVGKDLLSDKSAFGALTKLTAMCSDKDSNMILVAFRIGKVLGQKWYFTSKISAYELKYSEPNNELFQ